MNEYKLIFTGPTGAGKTTAIRAISERSAVSTDVVNTDATVDKAMTTVGLDFGEVTLDSGDKLRLFGTPGQLRFAFMWDILSKGAMGVIVLIDYRTKDAVGELAAYLTHFRDTIGSSACVVGIGRTEGVAGFSLDAFAHAARQVGVLCPIIPIDVRDRAQVLTLIDLLLIQLEHK
jgi:uncharacterized protein